LIYPLKMVISHSFLYVYQRVALKHLSPPRSEWDRENHEGSVKPTILFG
jgi:hypothetical protein